MPVLVAVVEVVVAILPVVANLVAAILPVFTVLIAKFITRREPVLEVVAPILRRRWARRPLAGPQAVTTGAITKPRQQRGAPTWQTRASTGAWTVRGKLADPRALARPGPGSSGSWARRGQLTDARPRARSGAARGQLTDSRSAAGGETRTGPRRGTCEVNRAWPAAGGQARRSGPCADGGARTGRGAGSGTSAGRGAGADRWA